MWYSSCKIILHILPAIKAANLNGYSALTNPPKEVTIWSHMESDDLALVWKALADPSRRKILDLLKERPRTTGELCEAFEVSRFAVMKHLKVLEEAGLIVVRWEGRQRWNHLNAVPIQQIYERWVSEFEAHWASSLLDLKRFAEVTEGEPTMMADHVSGADLYTVHIEQAVTIKASPERVFKALTQEISLWWRAPFFHGDAKQMVLEPHLGGRLYEDWGEGTGLLLATVVLIKPPEELRLAGALGMAGPVSGDIRFRLEAEGTGTRLKLSHRATGVLNEETQASYSAGWEALLGTHLRQYVEQHTNRP
jgi:DNA-binding transcriptional ArsR family regulator/uncharacterized protein YndB with AHSA1/START domain